MIHIYNFKFITNTYSYINRNFVEIKRSPGWNLINNRKHSSLRDKAIESFIDSQKHTEKKLRTELVAYKDAYRTLKRIKKN